MSNDLATALAELEEDSVINIVKGLKEKGTPTFEILDELQKGMEEVGRRFEKKEYFLSELLMSGDIFKSAVEVLGDAFNPEDSSKLGTVIIGTVKDDIHDIGKDIVASMLSCNGFKVIDLGIDVPAEVFINAIKEHNPQIIGMSCLLTSCFESMKNIIAAIDEAGLRTGRKIIIGGGTINEKVAEYVKADDFSTNAQEAVIKCKKMVQ